MRWLTPFLGIIAVAIAPLFVWLASKRATSGRVATTDAGTLWHEAQAMRAEYRAEADRLRAENSALRAEVSTGREQMIESQSETMRATTLLAKSRAEATGLRAKLARVVKP